MRAADQKGIGLGPGLGLYFKEPEFARERGGRNCDCLIKLRLLPAVGFHS